MELDDLVKAAFNHAKHYLREAGEFYPFGVVITNEDNIVPISVYMDNE